MPSKPRPPITYPAQFDGGIFRDPEEIAEERAALDETPPAEPAEKPAASKRASTLARAPESVIAAIRKVVKSYGREVSFVRLSPEEKGELADLVHDFKRRGLKTTENEINRIAINYLLADHRQHGERSILARTLEALRE